MTEHTKEPRAEYSPRCAFCFKYEDEVECLVAGPIVSICDACIALSLEGLKERGATAKINRAKACVNACAGIPTEALESGAVQGAITALMECTAKARFEQINKTPLPAICFSWIEKVAGAALTKLKGDSK